MTEATLMLIIGPIYAYLLSWAISAAYFERKLNYTRKIYEELQPEGKDEG